jgi:hypothetical protein
MRLKQYWCSGQGTQWCFEMNREYVRVTSLLDSVIFQLLMQVVGPPNGKEKELVQVADRWR